MSAVEIIKRMTPWATTGSGGAMLNLTRMRGKTARRFETVQQHRAFTASWGSPTICADLGDLGAKSSSMGGWRLGKLQGITELRIFLWWIFLHEGVVWAISLCLNSSWFYPFTVQPHRILRGNKMSWKLDLRDAFLKPFFSVAPM